MPGKQKNSKTPTKVPEKLPMRALKPKTKPSKPLTPWNVAMGEATRMLRAQDPSLKGPDLFRKGAVLAHKIIDEKNQKQEGKETDNKTIPVIPDIIAKDTAPASTAPSEEKPLAVVSDQLAKTQ